MESGNCWSKHQPKNTTQQTDRAITTRQGGKTDDCMTTPEKLSKREEKRKNKP
jgi:hypothetical protein